MRIEILVNGGGSISVLQNDLKVMQSRINDTIDSYRRQVEKLNGLPGGINHRLQTSLDGLNAKICAEEEKLAHLPEIWQKVRNFSDNTVQTDKAVASKFSQNSKEFYRRFPHLQVNVSVEKTWWEKLADGWNAFWGSAGDALSNAWKGIVDWYNTHPIISRVVIGIAAVAAGAAVTLLTGGAALPFLVGAGGLLAASTVIGAAIGGITGGLDGMVQGAADGFMFGGLAALSGAIIGLTSLTGGSAVIANGTLAGGMGGGITGGLSTGTMEGFTEGLFSGALSGLIFSSISVGIGNAIKLHLRRINNPSPDMPYSGNSRPSFRKSFPLEHNQDFHAGHKWGHEYRWLKSDYLNGYVSKEQLVNQYNNHSHYQLQSAAYNFSHIGESTKPLLQHMFPSLTNGVNTRAFPVVISAVCNDIGFNMSKLLFVKARK